MRLKTLISCRLSTLRASSFVFENRRPKNSAYSLKKQTLFLVPKKSQLSLWNLADPGFWKQIYPQPAGLMEQNIHFIVKWDHSFDFFPPPFLALISPHIHPLLLFLYLPFLNKTYSHKSTLIDIYAISLFSLSSFFLYPSLYLYSFPSHLHLNKCRHVFTQFLRFQSFSKPEVAKT